MEKAQQLVYDYVVDKLENVIGGDQDFEVYVVWFCKTLKNWKAMVSTSLPDQMYYEVTYNGDMKETYVVAYKEVENVRVVD